MVRRAALFCLLVLLAAAAAACSDDKKAAGVTNPLLPPADYKREIISTLRNLFQENQTVSVTNAVVTDPAIKQVGTSQIYSVCVRYTAHGTSPGLVGDAQRIAYFYAGHINQLVPAEEGQCAGAAYKPFPELDQVCIGKGCH